MNPWSTDASWQNFSSLCQEAHFASQARDEIAKFHHLTAALYFGISAIEAFMNRRMRAHMNRATENEIFEVLRNTSFRDKVNRWPDTILGKDINLSTETSAKIKLFNTIRGDLTHPKDIDGGVYRDLESIDPAAIVPSVAEFYVSFLSARGEEFPYWLLGWNYLNPKQGKYEMLILHNQQFLFSLQCLGFRVPASDAAPAESWRQQSMTSYAGYCSLKQSLDGVEHCEPKDALFAWRPTLCREWWAKEHQLTCGNVTPEAIARALEIDASRRRP